MSSTVTLLLMAVSCSIANGQGTIATTTIPPTSDNNPAIISEPVNATNTSIFCEIEITLQLLVGASKGRLDHPIGAVQWPPPPAVFATLVAAYQPITGSNH